ncbi:MAG: hypothetical protein H7240_03520 [Glaciimonas sp.]|nr:hypothetical protein [Glaciimonas sp.]
MNTPYSIKFIGYVAMAASQKWRKTKTSLPNAPIFRASNAKAVSMLPRYLESKQIELEQANNRIFLPKLSWICYRNNRDVLGELRNVNVRQSGGKWFVSIQTQRKIEQALFKATTAIGI